MVPVFVIAALFVTCMPVPPFAPRRRCRLAPVATLAAGAATATSHARSARLTWRTPFNRSHHRRRRFRATHCAEATRAAATTRTAGAADDRLRICEWQRRC